MFTVQFINGLTYNRVPHNEAKFWLQVSLRANICSVFIKV